MSYKQDCHYLEFQDKSSRGWWWRLELLPAVDTAEADYFDGANNVFVPFSDNIIIADSIELETTFDDQPLGIASTPTMKLLFARQNMTADEFETIVLNEGWNTGGFYDIKVTNVWILRTNSGVGGVSSTSDIYFVGIQRADGGYQDKIGDDRKSKCEITIANALSELARISTLDKFAEAVFTTWIYVDSTWTKKYSTTYQQIWNNTSSVFENFRDDNVVTTKTIAINYFILLHIRDIIKHYYRLPESMVKCIGFSHSHLQMFAQSTSTSDGEHGSAIGTETALVYEGATAPVEQTVWFILATLAHYADSYSTYADLGHGLLVRSGSSGSYFEGETIADMLTNLATGWGAKQMYVIRNNKMVLSSAPILDDTTASDDYGDIVLNLASIQTGGMDVSTGKFSGLMRSVTYNIDGAGSDDATEYKYQIAGNLSEEDFSKKCIIHNLPRIRDYEQRGAYSIDAYRTDIAEGLLKEARANSWRNAGFDLRKFWYYAQPSGWDSGLPDDTVPIRCHVVCGFNDGGGLGFQAITPISYVMDNTHWKGALIEQQATSGLPNTLAKYVGLALSNKRRAVFPFKVSMEYIGINHIGRVIQLEFDSYLSQYSYLHDTGGDSARTIVLGVKSNIMKNESEGKFLVLPRD